MALQTLQVPEEFKFVLDRGIFSSDRALSNLVFMLDKHIADKDDSFCDGELYNRLKERSLETYVERDEFTRGTIYNLFPEGEEPRFYWFNKDNRELNYYPIDEMEEEAV